MEENPDRDSINTNKISENSENEGQRGQTPLLGEMRDSDERSSSSQRR